MSNKRVPFSLPGRRLAPFPPVSCATVNRSIPKFDLPLQGGSNLATKISSELLHKKNPIAIKMKLSFTLFTLHCYRIRVGLGIP